MVVTSVMLASLDQFKTMLERTVVTERSPAASPLRAIPVAAPVMAALLKVEISMLRPSAAVNLTSPVLSLVAALTPVLDVLALMAVAICVPRSIAVKALSMAPISTPLI